MPESRLQRNLYILALIVAGEAIFGLPFHVSRFFRPTMLPAFGLTNFELGALFSFYGVVAMISYLPGGVLADRFSARRLMTLSLLSTAAAGFYLATMPPVGGLRIVFAFFGATTILVFWAALIRSTREWGGSQNQGRAFGVLDAGRGVFAAGLASLVLIPFNAAFSGDPALATQEERVAAIRIVIYIYTAATIGAAVFVWFAVPERGGATKRSEGMIWREIGRAFLMPKVWLQALLVVCAYSAYKGIDNYSLYAVQVYGMNEVDGAQVSVLGSWMRPFAALGAGLAADRSRPTFAALVCFAVLFAGYCGFIIVPPDPSTTVVLWANVIVTCAMAFGLRGVYFAVMEEVDIPPHITGTAVGLISLVGFTPDIFVAPIGGWLLDRNPGLPGHQHFFMFLAVFAALGMVASVLIHRLNRGAAQT